MICVGAIFGGGCLGVADRHHHLAFIERHARHRGDDGAKVERAGQ